MHAPRPQRGLTSMDVVIVAALLALAVLAWLPSRHVERVLAAEDDVMRTLRELATRVEAHREEARLDSDGDGRGETPELGALLEPADAFAASPDGAAWGRGGYWYALLVPGPDHVGQLPGAAPSTDSAEATYLLMAWPVEPGESGMRAYLRTPVDGLLRHAVDGYPYGGPDAPPVPRLALVERSGGTLRPVSLKSNLWVAPRETLRTRD